MGKPKIETNKGDRLLVAEAVRQGPEVDMLITQKIKSQCSPLVTFFFLFSSLSLI